MPCFHPLAAWRAKQPNPSGKTPITFRWAEADTSRPTETPCGRCIGCRLAWAREWGIRMMHEFNTTESRHPGMTYFCTFTYSEEHLPWSEESGTMTLRPLDFTLFMKRLRYDQVERGNDGKIRYFQGGEYGEKTERPHHHALLYAIKLDDLKRLNPRTPAARALYASDYLSRLWQKGHVTVATNVTLQAARYIAAYVTKKKWAQSATDLEKHYHGRTPEYHTMSRRPGLGREFWDRFHQDIINARHVSVLHSTRKLPVPRYYQNLWEQHDGDSFAAFRAELETTIRSRTGRELLASEEKHHGLARMNPRELE